LSEEDCRENYYHNSATTVARSQVVFVDELGVEVVEPPEMANSGSVLIEPLNDLQTHFRTPSTVVTQLHLRGTHKLYKLFHAARLENVVCAFFLANC
jgi:hypothetical protein